MFFRVNLILGLAMVALPANGAEIELPYSRVPVHATLFKGKLYGFFGVRTQKSKVSIPEYDLFAVEPATPDLTKGAQYVVNGASGFGLRHHIGHRSVWIMRHPYQFWRLNVEELQLFDVLNPNREKEYREKYPKAAPGPLQPNSWHHAFFLSTLRWSALADGDAIGGPAPNEVPALGAVPISETSCKCYVLRANTKMIRVWDCAFTWNDEKIHWDPKPSPGLAKIDQLLKGLESASFQARAKASAELEAIGYSARPSLEKFIASKPSAEARRRAEELLQKSKDAFRVGPNENNYEVFASLFVEDFLFFIRKGDYYFVTESGKLYFAQPPGKGEATRTMKPLWTDAKRPIVAVIEDADNDRVWLFAKSKEADAKRDHYFEMTEANRPKPFDPAKLTPAKMEGRAKTVLEYLPLIYADNKEK